MKLINKTDLRNNHIRSFVRQIAKREMVDLKHATFNFVYRRGHKEHISGFAFYGMPARVTIKIPRDKTVDKVELAYLVSHELAHSQGLRHKQMKNSIYSRRYARKHGEDWGKHYTWANDLPLDLKPVEEKIKPTSDQIIRLKLDRCLKMVNKWYTKVKISQTLFKKWKQKSSYYEKKLKQAAEWAAEIPVK